MLKYDLFRDIPKLPTDRNFNETQKSFGPFDKDSGQIIRAKENLMKVISRRSVFEELKQANMEATMKSGKRKEKRNKSVKKKRGK